MRIALLILGVGNPSRGDDALGPECLRRIEQGRAQDDAEVGITLVEDFQLQIEHALDLVAQDRVLFVDASVSCRAPYEFKRVHPDMTGSYTSHEMDPAALLYVYGQAHKHPPPPSYLLTVRGECFDLGEGLSEAGRRNLEAAYAFLRRLLMSASAEFWDICAG